MKLSAKASLLLSGIVFVVIAATSVFLFSYQQKAVTELLKRQVETEACSLAGMVRAFSDEKLRAVAAISGSLPLSLLHAGDAQGLSDYLKRQLFFFPKFASLYILDREGRLLADFPPHPGFGERSFANREYYQRTMAQEKGIVGAPYVSPLSGHPALIFTAPVRSASGQILAVICASLELGLRASPLDLAHRTTGKSGFAFVVDEERRIIMHPDASRILQPVDEKGRAFLSSVLDEPGAREAVDGTGEPVLVGSRRVPNLDWTVVAQLPVKEATDSLRDAVVAVGLFFLAAMAVVLPAGLLIMRRIAKPLEALEDAVLVITQDLRTSEGALTRPFAAKALDALRKMRSSDEIGKLARAFFQLSLRLKQTLGSLRMAAKDWERTFSSVQEALLVLDSAGNVLRLNRVAEDLCRTSKSGAVGRHWREVLADGHPAPEDWPSAESLGETDSLKLTSSLPSRPGVFEFSFSAIEGRKDSKGFLLMVTDVTEKMQAEERIRELAFHDPLTRLPNRLLLADRMEQAIATANRNGSKVGVLFLDLDDFKLVNDTYGHAFGDELLKQVARRLTACLRLSDTLARYAGDEFVAVLIDLSGPEEAGTIASRMVMALNEPFTLSDRKAASIGVSIGIAIYPTDGVTPDKLIKHADLTMYRAKGHGKNNVWSKGSPAAPVMDELPKQ